MKQKAGLLVGPRLISHTTALEKKLPLYAKYAKVERDPQRQHGGGNGCWGQPGWGRRRRLQGTWAALL